MVDPKVFDCEQSHFVSARLTSPLTPCDLETMPCKHAEWPGWMETFYFTCKTWRKHSFCVAEHVGDLWSTRSNEESKMRLASTPG